MPTSADTSECRLRVLSTRREWSVAEKRAIVAESRMPGANVSEISRRRGAAQSLIYQWRKMFDATGEPPFLSVSIAAPQPIVSPPVPPQAPIPPPATSAMIEIELASGRKLRVAADVDTAALARIVAALETPK